MVAKVVKIEEGAEPKEEMKAEKRARGGRIHGMKAKGHPGKRARGGATGGPYSEAGHMSVPEYEKPHPGPNEGGKGADNVGMTGRG